MTDEQNRPDDVVEGFDLPGGEPTPPPEGGTVGDANPPPETTPVAKDFDLPTGEGTPPPADIAEVESHVKRAEAREVKPPSALGKFIALIVIPVVAIAAVIWMQMRRQQVEEDYMGAYVKAADHFLRDLDKDSVESIPQAYAMLHQDLRQRVDSLEMRDEYMARRGALGTYKRLDRVEWDDASGGVKNSFRAVAVFESGLVPVHFWMSGKDEVRITKYTLGAGKRAAPEDEEGGEPAYKADYVEQTERWLSALAAGDNARAHEMLVDTLEEKKSAAALKIEFDKVFAGYGKFDKLVDVTWDPIGANPTSFRATAVFEKGRGPVWIDLSGYFSIEVVEYRFGKAASR
jgi:hypothetical protein